MLPFGGEVVPELDSVLAVIHAARDRIETDGYLDEEELEHFERVVGFGLEGMARPGQRLTRTADEARRTEVLTQLARHEEELAGLRSRLVEHEARASADVGGVVLPDEATTNLLLRYEAAAERQFTRTLHELERLQRMRAGEAVPPRLHLEVTSD